MGLKNSKEFSCRILSLNSSYQIIWQRGTLSHLAIQKYSQTKSFSDPGTVCWSSLPVTGWPVIYSQILTFHSRFETSKKKLAFLSFSDFSIVCKEVRGSIAYLLYIVVQDLIWSYKVMLFWSPEGQQVDDSGEPLLDKDFFYTLRLITDWKRQTLSIAGS